jgi:hypothetical protein
MTDDAELNPREASDFSDEELQQLVRDVIGSMLRADLAERALAWLDQRIADYQRVRGQQQ